MNDVNLREPNPFSPPVVAIADPEDGLIKTADLDRPVAVQLKVWEESQVGHQCQLTIDGTYTGYVRTITNDDKIGDVMSFYLDESLLTRNGIYSLGYRTYSPITGLEDFSPTIAIKVDRTPPGATLLAPFIFSDEMISGQAIGRIPGYFDMELGDTIQTVCNGSLGPAYKVQADDFTVRPIEVTFAKDFVESLGSESVLITYTVTDRAGNVSVMSETTHVTVIA